VDFHAIIEVPKGKKQPHFARVPELEGFAATDTEAKVLALLRGFRGHRLAQYPSSWNA
jgi:hypothetical protein